MRRSFSGHENNLHIVSTHFRMLGSAASQSYLVLGSAYPDMRSEARKMPPAVLYPFHFPLV
jgi:hypothetical protein